MVIGISLPIQKRWDAILPFCVLNHACRAYELIRYDVLDVFRLLVRDIILASLAELLVHESIFIILIRASA